MTDTLPTTSTGDLTGQDAVAFVQQSYPQLAWMLNIPELANVIIALTQQGITDPNRIQASIENTQWWQTQSSTARAFIQTEMTDPAAAQQTLGQEQDSIRATLEQLGLKPDQGQINSFAYEAIMNGWSTQQLMDHIGQAIQPQSDGTFKLATYVLDPTTGKEVDVFSGLHALYGPNGEPGYPNAQLAPAGAQSWTQPDGTQVWYMPGTETSTVPGKPGDTVPTGGLAPIPGNVPGAAAGPGALLNTTQQLQQLAKQYMVNVSPQTLAQWSQQIAMGQTTLDAFHSYVQQTASSQFPWMRQGIAEGQTPLQLVNPYGSMVANELGISADSIDWTQPKWSKLLSASDPKTGTLTQLPIWQATQIVRSDPSYGWEYTPSARNASMDMVATLEQAMGFRNFGGINASMPASYGSSGG